MSSGAASKGYGRGGRMKIETDRAEIVAGVRHSKTIGVADCDHHSKQGLEELDRGAAGGRIGRRAGEA